MNKKKIIIIVSIFILVICLVGGSFALYTLTLSNDVGINTNTPGLDKYIVYEKGKDITGTLNTSANYYGGTSSDIEFWKKDDTYNIYGQIVLTVNTIGSNLSNSSALKYALVNNGNVLSSGSLKGTSNGSKVTLARNLRLQTTKQIYTVYVWLDVNEALESIEGETLSISVDCSAENVYVPTIADYITNLYTSADKTEVNNNNITYNYATSVSLMNDRLGGTTSDYSGGNVRYYGASPNNYIYFNCDDYSNQTSATCELWRIIGVFDNKVRIMKNGSIGTYSWDNKDTSTGAESTYGKNDWTTARIMKLLNPGVYYTTDINDEDYGQSLYYNGVSGTCFNGNNNITTSCDFASIGLKNDFTRDMIAEDTYYLRDSDVGYVNTVYNNERTMGNVYTGRVTSWKGKVALAYPSDYGYAADLSKCNQTLSNYSNSTCSSNNWMKAILGTSNNGWLITQYSGDSYKARSVTSTGSLNDYGNEVRYSSDIIPVLALDSDLIMVGGQGTASSPYQVK